MKAPKASRRELTSGTRLLQTFAPFRYVRRRYNRCAASAWVLALLSSCQAPKPPGGQFTAAFRILDDRATPVAGAEIRVGRKRLGRSDEHGTLRAKLEGSEGEELPVFLQCPSGYESSPELPAFKLQSLLELDKQATESRYTARCTRSRRSVAIVIRVNQKPAIPVFVNGSLQGRTDEDGLLHCLHELEPNSMVRIKLDTSQSPELRPRDPLRTFAVDGEDAVVLFDQEFQAVAIKPKVRRPSPQKEAPRPVPYRLE